MNTTRAPVDAILLTLPETAHELRCSSATVYREIHAGKLAARRIRRKLFVHRDDLNAYLSAARVEYRPAAETAALALTRRQVSLRDAGLIDGDDFGYRPAQ
ncbi:DNA binding domain-containing protein, excisionase family [Singulisphaera sp. GP187]|uniref:helix-turn-helix domain-containing protein n=1 Tax=Singulisphaera sp. GP187 TaxID=1882752 RepID=UPI00092AD663|nr:helix-turn-helix domain-containing protein [Singulisphaera sp. GP187]SIN97774.1 DNA binding domain-containing protein, excisionase family [Singulisphaera sp. GP187]